MRKLKEGQRRALEKAVKSGITDGFYLAGGTALMIRYQHRWSEDFDFFSHPNYEFDITFLLERVSKITGTEVLSVKSDTLIILIDGWRFSFFSYPYKLLSKPRLWKRLSVRLAGDKDIAAMKSVAIMQRGSKKDFYDLYFLMKRHKWKLPHIIQFSRAKYGNLFDEKSFLKALIYFDDAEMESYPDIDPFWDNVKDFFVNSVREYVRGI